MDPEIGELLCEFPKDSVKLPVLTRIRTRTRTTFAGCDNNHRTDVPLSKTLRLTKRYNQQPGRIFETVNSDNNNKLTRRSHRRVSFGGNEAQVLQRAGYTAQPNNVITAITVTPINSVR